MNDNLKLLDMWRHAVSAGVRADSPDVSARQQAILLEVYLKGEAQTVRGLASTMHISKPAVSRALDRLGQLGFVRRQRDKLDRRNVIVQRTVRGSVYLTEFAGYIQAAQAHVATAPAIPESVFRPVEGVESEIVSLPTMPSHAPAADEPMQWADAAE